MKMRKQRLMGVGLIVISWLVLLLACTESESPEDNDRALSSTMASGATSNSETYFSTSEGVSPLSEM